MTIATSLVLFLTLAAQPASETIPGRYVARSDASTCQVLLLPSATRPPASQLTQTTQSGLAAVSPDCPLDISDAGLWQLADTQSGPVLSLTGHDGQSLWIGQISDQGWSGSTASGETLSLTREGR